MGHPDFLTSPEGKRGKMRELMSKYVPKTILALKLQSCG